MNFCPVTGQAKANVDFIAHARTDIPLLLDLVEAQRNLIEAINERDAIEGNPHVFKSRGEYNQYLLQAIDKIVKARHHLAALEEAAHANL